MTLQASHTGSTRNPISLNNLHTEVCGTSGTTCSLGDTDISTLIFKNPTDSKNLNEYYSTFWNKNTITFSCDTKLFIGGGYGASDEPAMLTGFMTEGAGGAGNNPRGLSSTGDAYGDDHGPTNSYFPSNYPYTTDTYYYQTNFGSCSDNQIRINGGPLREILSAFTTRNSAPNMYSMRGLFIGVKGSHGTSNGLNTTLGLSGTGRMQANTVCKQGSDPVSDPSGGLMHAPYGANSGQVNSSIGGGGSDYNHSTYAHRIAGTTLTSGTFYTMRGANRGGAYIYAGKPDYRLDYPTNYTTMPTGQIYSDYVSQEPAKTLKVGSSTYTSTAHTLYYIPRDAGHASADDPGIPTLFAGYYNPADYPSYQKFLDAEAANTASYDATGTVHNYPTGAHAFRHGASITLTFT